MDPKNELDQKIEDLGPKVELTRVKKIVVNKLNTRSGIKALGGSVSNNSCTGAICYTF